MRRYSCGQFQLQGGLSDMKSSFVTDGQSGSRGRRLCYCLWLLLFPHGIGGTWVQRLTRALTLLLQMRPVQVRPFTPAVREGMSPHSGDA